jgi:hypothetical protein
VIEQGGGAHQALKGLVGLLQLVVPAFWASKKRVVIAWWASAATGQTRWMHGSKP